MTARPEVQNLEAALTERARRLAEEYRARGRQTRDGILHDGNERLRLREERAVLAAQAMADRLHRRRVQASEIKLHGELDQLRWDLIQSAMQELPERLRSMAADEARYVPLLQRFLAQASQAIGGNELIAELNAQDLARLQVRWEAFAQEAVPDKTITLSPEPWPCSGGVRVQNKDKRIRVDNTFEGRIERFRDALHQALIERLFARDTTPGAIVHVHG